MKVKKPLLVIDTNVWISGVLLKTGTPAMLIRRSLQFAQPVFTSETFTELEERLWRPKFDRYVTIEQRKRLLHDIKAVAQWIIVPENIANQSFSRDRDDDKFIHAALVTKAECLITGDKDLLVLTDDLRTLNIKLFTPADALSYLV